MNLATPVRFIYPPRVLRGTVFDVSPWLIFLLICIVFSLAKYIQNEIVFTDQVIYNTFIERLSAEQVEKMLDRDPNSFWVSLWLVPLGILLQVFAIAIWMNIDTILMDYKIRFEHLFRISLVSFFVFALGKAVYTLSILYTDIQSIDDALFFRFSLLELLGKDQVHRLLIYPLSIFTVYQLFFVLVFNLGLGYVLDKPFRQTLLFTFGCYALALITWALFVLFVGLNLFS